MQPQDRPCVLGIENGPGPGYDLSKQDGQEQLGQ